MIQQNSAIAQSALAKINEKTTENMDSVPIFESLSFDELREMILYCIFPAIHAEHVHKALPPVELFPHNLAFHGLHPRESSGPQQDTIELLEQAIRYEQEMRGELRKKVLDVCNSLFEEIIDVQEVDKIHSQLLQNILSMNDTFHYLLLSPELLTRCMQKTELLFSSRLEALAHLGKTPRSLLEPSDTFLFNFLTGGTIPDDSKTITVKTVFNVLCYRKNFLLAMKCLPMLPALPTIWDVKFTLAHADFIECIKTIQAMSVSVNQEDSCGARIEGVDWLIEIIDACEDSVRIGLYSVIKSLTLDPRLSGDELAEWIKKRDDHTVSQTLLFGGKKLVRLHEAADKALQVNA